MTEVVRTALREVVAGRSVAPDVLRSAFVEIMDGDVPQALTGGLLCALATRNESAEELASIAGLMRTLSTEVPLDDRANLLDTCGTGGDGAGLFNVSTAAALVAASGGARVAKHGNRAASGYSGSADVLERLGLPLTLTPGQVGRCIEDVGIGFMFAPMHHGAMKAVAPVRQSLGVPTLFNLLGPLTNPAGAKRQLLGVGRIDKTQLMARALLLLGCERALVVHSEDGLDELSIADTTHVIELKDGKLLDYRVAPSDFDVPGMTDLDGLRAASPDASAELVRTALNPKHARARHPASLMVGLNAGAALYVAGVSETLKGGIVLADDLLCSGQAKTKLQEWIDYARVCADAHVPKN